MSMKVAPFRAPARTAVLVGLFLLSACARRPLDPPFYREYRDRYAITTDELKKLQFYISAEVLAQAMDGSSNVTPEQIVVVPARTPGLVRDAGPDWIRVAFREGGEGVLFRLQNKYAGAVYGLATTTEGGGIALLSELRKPVLTQGGRQYAIIQGANAFLIVSAEDINRLINSRPHAEGLKRE